MSAVSLRSFLIAGVAFAALASNARAQEQAHSATDYAALAADLEEVVVTARRREESAQSVPIALTVVDAKQLEATGTYNIAQVVQLAPSLYLNAFNPRNTTVNIRGLGNNLGLANDGLEPGVGLYIDQVYLSRPAATTFDLVDIAQVEILRGPQGTLFGKNTTAGALNITTRAPSFTPEGRFEASFGDYGFWQAKASVSGPLSDIAAFRVSVSSTQRDGLIRNVLTGQDANNQDNLAFRGQLLLTPSEQLSVRLTADFSRQLTDCCALVYAGFGPTLRPADRQFPALAAALNYAPPSTDPFARLTDINDISHANQQLGGLSAIIDLDLGWADLTSVSAWRFWDWDPANDADFTRLSVITNSINADKQRQLSQEFRLASKSGGSIDWIVGLYGFWQEIEAWGGTRYGTDATPYLLNATLPRGLLDGYGSDFNASSETDSYAVFGQLTWRPIEKLSITPGLRYTYEQKSATYDARVSGGLAPANAAQAASKLALARPQRYAADESDGSLSGQLNLAYQLTPDILLYANYARGYKSGGLNLSGLPVDATGAPLVAKAVVAPEKTDAWELGVKSAFFERLTVNLAAFLSETQDYQANVVEVDGATARTYLDNVEEVRSRGVELDVRLARTLGFTAYASTAFTDAEYISYANGPCPLELIGPALRACDLSGRPLPGVSRWVVSTGGEYAHELSIGAAEAQLYAGAEYNWRSGFFSNASDSVYSRIDAYGVLNLRLGLRSADDRWDAFLWSKNALDEEYFQYVTAGTGSTGLLLANPADPRTVGLTLRARY